MENLKRIWNGFLHWEGWKTCAHIWMAFLHWHGWHDFIRWKGWAAFAAWRGWKKILFPHPLITVLLTVLSGAGLWLVFTRGFDMHPIGYAVYVLSAYTLTLLVVGLPNLIAKILGLIHDHPGVEKLLKDGELHFKLELYFEELLNFCYGIFKIISGVIVGSAWIGADGIYNLTQGVMQLFQILQRRRNLTLDKQWKSYRLCGILTLVLHHLLRGCP